MWLYKIIHDFFFLLNYLLFLFLEVLFLLTIFLKGIKAALALGRLCEF